MKAIVLLLWISSFSIWSCTAPGTAKERTTGAAYTTKPVKKSQSSSDPFRSQLRRFGYDAATGVYKQYRADQGC